jgi:hypothetical protein
MTAKTPPRWIADSRAKDRRAELIAFGDWILDKFTHTVFGLAPVELAVDEWIQEREQCQPPSTRPTPAARPSKASRGGRSTV